MDQITIQDSFAYQDGGSIYIENDSIDVIISNSNIVNTTAKDGQGGFAVLTKGRWLNVSSTILTNSWAPEGRIMVVDS